MFKVSFCNEVVTSGVTATHLMDFNLTRLASDLGQMRQKYHCTVPLYGTYLGGLRHWPPQMKSQHGLNEGKNLIGKKKSLN